MSTARHQLAGAPGTGTTIDNMASRVKAWARINGATAAALDTFNVSSTTDTAVGQHTLTYTAFLANYGAYPVVATTTAGGGFFIDITGVGNNAVTCSAYAVNGTTLIDITQKSVLVAGALA